MSLVLGAPPGRAQRLHVRADAAQLGPGRALAKRVTASAPITTLDGIDLAADDGMPSRLVFDAAPLRVYWETTNACDLACRHCRAEASPAAESGELSTAEGLRLLGALARFGAPLPHLVLTGGDPLKRDDLFDLVDGARALGFGVSLAPSATPLLTDAAIRRMKHHGIDAISLSLDGSDAARHDAIRQVPGTFERTRLAASTAREIGLPFQVNTLVCEETVDDLEAIHREVLAMGASRWSLFFLVTVGRGDVLAPISPERAEEVLAWAARLGAAARAAGGSGLVVTTTEAPQIRRVLAEQRRVEHAPSVASDAQPEAHAGALPGGRSRGVQAPSHGAGIRDGNGILFISNTGRICPSGFLEVEVGNVRDDDVVDVYRDARLFRSLREPAGFGGRCGRCEYKLACGGSRARAWAATGDPLAEDPLCPYEPGSVVGRA